MTDKDPVYPIGVAARLCSVHPQTLRAYERMGLVVPARHNEKNRMYSEADVLRVRQIQRLTQELGVNLAGVEVIMRLLDQMEEMKADLEAQMARYIQRAEERLSHLARESKAPVPRQEPLLPALKLSYRKNLDI
jgi:MerR family transcriptional regulator/heat shock protein HspR